MNDVGKLYMDYLKAIKILDSCVDYQTEDPELKNVLSNIYRNRKYRNVGKDTIIPVSQLREILAQWINKVMFENKITEGMKLDRDLFIWTLKGKRKERMRFMNMFLDITSDIVVRLNEIDGGQDEDQFQGVNVSGFRV